MNPKARKGYIIVNSLNPETITMRKEVRGSDFTIQRDFIFNKSTGHLTTSTLKSKGKSGPWIQDSYIEFTNWNLSPTIASDAFKVQIPDGWTESPNPLF